MAYQAPKIERIGDNIIRIYHPDYLAPRTYLTASVAATGTTLTVVNNEGFAEHDVVLLEGFGIENAEIKEVNAAVTAGTSLTITAATFAHGINCAVQKILFDQVEVSGTTTLTGSKAHAATMALNAGGNYTDYVLSSDLQGDTYIFARYYNSMASTPFYSSYSDGLSADFGPKTVGFIRRNAFANIGEKYDGVRFTSQWVYDQIYLGELDVAKELRRWSWLYSFDYDLGNLTEGLRRIALPSDIEDDKTNKSIMGVRIEDEINMDYMDWTEYQDAMNGVAYTTLATAASIGDTTLVLTDSRDFEDSGSVNIAGTSYTYTTNTRSTNTLSGLTALSAGIAVDSEIWQSISFGTPGRYAINDGYLYFDIPPDSDLEGRNIWIDYYKTITKCDSDNDEVEVADPQLIISWLEMAIKKEKANGALNLSDVSYVTYNRRKELLVKNEMSGQRMRFVPDVPLSNKPITWWR